MEAQGDFNDDTWLDVTAVCAEIGGSRPVHPATYYRGVRQGRYPAPEQRGLNVKRVSLKKLRAALRRLASADNEAA